jgi:hypothetical protein
MAENMTKMELNTPPPLPTIFLPFLAFPNKISWVRSGSFQMGTLFISSLNLEEDFPTTNLTGN